MSDFSRKIPVFLHVSKSEFPCKRRFFRKIRRIVPHVLKSDFLVFLHAVKSDFLPGRRINCQMRPVLLHVLKSDFLAFCRRTVLAAPLFRFGGSAVRLAVRADRLSFFVRPVPGAHVQCAVPVRRHAAERQNRPCGGRRLLVGHIGRHLGRGEQPPLPAQCLPGGLQVPAGGVKQRPSAVPHPEGGALSGRQSLHRHRPQQTARNLSGAAPAGDTLPQDVRQRHQSAARMLSRHTRSEGRKVKGSFCWFTSPIL